MPYVGAAKARLFVGQKHPERGRGVGPFVVRMDLSDRDGKPLSTRKVERPTVEAAERVARTWASEQRRNRVVVER